MGKKVSELLKELGITLKELKEYASKMDIDIKSKETTLDDSDVSRIISTVNLMKGTATDDKPEGARPAIKAVPVLNIETPKAKPPVGIPIKVVLPPNDAAPAEEIEDKPEMAETVKVVETEETQEESVPMKEEIPLSDKPEEKVLSNEKEVQEIATEKESLEKLHETKEMQKSGAPKEEKKIPEKKKEDVRQKETDGEAYVNAPNKPMRFKKISDAATERKKAEEKKKREQEKKVQPGNKDAEKKVSRERKKDNVRDTKKPTVDSDSRERRTPRDKASDEKRPFQRRQKDTSAQAPQTTGGKPSKRKSKKFFDNERQSKFDKFEDSPRPRRNVTEAIYDERALEKKERNKRKYKTKVVEEPTVEELLPEGTIAVTVPITVAGLSEQAEISVSQIIMAMMQMGVMVTINQTLDKDTVEMLAEDLGLQIVVTEEEPEIEEIGIETREDCESELEPRPPIITVMGHVDHGKTSLLDAIRNTKVTAGESGGITQHIGASEIEINDKKIVFLDTPGHEAFTTMRARGAQVTDIAVLVVAADDGVMPQTKESISHAKAAGVPIIVAINKMDKPTANPDRVKQELSENGVLVEEWGGDVISVPVSAKKGEGITDLLEMILLQAEVLELRANPNRLALGTVVEARLDKSKGPVATLLVSNGTLKTGQSVVAGTTSGKIRVMTDFKGKPIRKAGPSTPVEILGLSDVPAAGDEFNAVRDDKTAREIAANRQEKLREDVMAKNASMTLDKLFAQIQEGESKELNLIIKGDVQGSVGAIITSLEKLETDEVKIKVIHSGVGTINESDIMLAETSNAIIIGFNVRPTTAVTNQAAEVDVEIRLYRVIYDIIDDIQAAMKGMLEPEYREEILGKATVRETFKVPNLGIVAGCYITEGLVKRNAQIRLVRDGIVIHEGVISSLKRFKDDAREVAQGYECGLGIEKYNDIKPDDVIECFNMVEIER
ncbi:MAG TPA: translation initiation factor IF-2 [Mogibacterium sp.]|nr:translation initiation factor IF-2 [Mogibacterium sp.]